MKIEIKVFGLNINVCILIDEDKNIFLVNGKKTIMDLSEFRERLLGIVAFWDSKMIKKNVIDMAKYYISVWPDLDEKPFIFEGCGKYPENYGEFIILCEEALNGTMKF